MGSGEVTGGQSESGEIKWPIEGKDGRDGNLKKQDQDLMVDVK